MEKLLSIPERIRSYVTQQGDESIFNFTLRPTNIHVPYEMKRPTLIDLGKVVPQMGCCSSAIRTGDCYQIELDQIIFKKGLVGCEESGCSAYDKAKCPRAWRLSEKSLDLDTMPSEILYGRGVQDDTQGGSQHPKRKIF